MKPTAAHILIKYIVFIFSRGILCRVIKRTLYRFVIIVFIITKINKEAECCRITRAFNLYMLVDLL